MASRITSRRTKTRRRKNTTAIKRKTSTDLRPSSTSVRTARSTSTNLSAVDANEAFHTALSTIKDPVDKLCVIEVFADNEHGWAQYYMGVALEKGEYANRDLQAARNWYVRAMQTATNRPDEFPDRKIKGQECNLYRIAQAGLHRVHQQIISGVHQAVEA